MLARVCGSRLLLRKAAEASVVTSPTGDPRFSEPAIPPTDELQECNGYAAFESFTAKYAGKHEQFSLAERVPAVYMHLSLHVKRSASPSV
jgi:hypothetical protein